jgi:hypothetical protein
MYLLSNGERIRIQCYKHFLDDIVVFRQLLVLTDDSVK